MYHETPTVQQRFRVAKSRAETQQVESAQAQAAPGWVRIGATWREAIAIFGAHALPILLCACAGFALPAVLGAFLNVPSVDLIVRNPVTLCAYQAPQASLALMLGLLALLAQTLARGMITSIALRGRQPALRAAVARFPALLCGCMIYGAAMSIAQAGLSLPLTALQLDPAQLYAGITPDRSLEVIGRDVSAQSVNALLPDPGRLFCDVATSIAPVHGPGQLAIAADPTVLHPYSYAASYTTPPPLQWAGSGEFWRIAIGSLILLIMAETLLRFRVVAALAGVRKRSIHSVRRALAGGIKLAWARFGLVSLHVWLLRGAILFAQVLFVAAPITLAQHIFIPRVAQMIGAPWMVQACVLAISVGTALIEGALLAFATVYDARLFLVLSGSAGIPAGSGSYTIQSSRTNPGTRLK